MDKNKKPAQKSFNQPVTHNDQLGENASEEFQSEKYDNTGNGKDKNRKK